MALPVGSYAVDTRTGQLGRVMGHEGPYVQLRPLGGGREWDCAPEAVRGVTLAEHDRPRAGEDGAPVG
ncbi:MULTISPECIES: hypothetical protein [Streptomyces]|uniref:Secreted protein n=2 Tax=Streptomyces TaxID=1883 RepID=A0A0B5EVB4_STRA4|nr:MULTISPECIES: hypothetical protein [Streptomyces]AJE85734.1 hypothetical protein SLNWT_5358 [Streptomyces albus]AOU80036.1 hypothetical protein SLNHY_5345 [Streptomyces albus]AYN35754.1 hypothetical protein DUI70_5258 [Streptomyces albus]NKI45496.1 hypothetical protein [Streptomyces physcomitrii]